SKGEGGEALTQRRREEGHEALRSVLPEQRGRSHGRAAEARSCRSEQRGVRGGHRAVHGGAADPPGDDRRSVLQAVVEPGPLAGAEEGEDLLADRHGLRRLSSSSSRCSVDTVKGWWDAPMSTATLLYDRRQASRGTGERR